MRVPDAVVPSLVLVAAAAGILGARLLEAPSVVLDFGPAVAGPSRAVGMVVQGVRCVDTAERCAHQLDEVPGVRRFTAWASRARVEIEYDPAAVDVPALVEAIEGPVYDGVAREYRFGTYVVREVDGRKTDS